MRIGELARRTGASPRALRYYEQQRLLASGRGDNGYREYSEDAVVRVRNIRLLLAAGLGSDDIRELDACLSRDLAGEPTCAQAAELYQRRLDAVQARLDALLDVKERLSAQLGEIRAGRA
ncbi:MerR family transcriptional regulator [Allonocardiopsis opalescens]|uniref:DNA-binding transcriptional MerR regulator n=1 Tax=Allonocardiopsis opalescens TaxID=1144618 RepID=A0A2T0Q5E9_9ACTN|nr:MerR family transcriptional regulator [Allonocardiopsis opalescens]PRX99047.1 DNA-binding transcriptional MerR regulator [Allonocardiopsis opalescens]